jgi:hypothetical protein
LNGNAKLYGANNALDTENESNSWYSDGQADGNTEHSYIVDFHRDVKIKSISLLFQGGFVSEECQFYTGRRKIDNDLSTLIVWTEIEDAYIEPENTNKLQDFDMEEVSNQDDLNCLAIKLVFHSSTDFYGRVVLYKIMVHGEEKLEKC